MKIVTFKGGLGNQMFQYAYYLALKKRYKAVYADLSFYEGSADHNGFELSRSFGLQVNQSIFVDGVKKVVHKLLKSRIALEPITTFFQNDLLLNPKYILYDGYWQDSKYFTDIEQSIVSSFKFRNIPPCDELLNKLQNCQSVSVHIRLGDYLKNDSIYGIDRIQYIDKAKELIRSKIGNPIFFIFSDDIKWCRENLSTTEGEHIFIDSNRGDNSYWDMYFMSQCQHNIIANSSFSWWGAFLNQNKEKIIIAPKLWFKDRPQLNIALKDWLLL